MAVFRVVVAAWLVGTLCVDSTDPFAIIATFNNIYDRSRHALPRCWGSRFGMGFGGSAATVPNRTAYPRTGSTIDLRRPYVAPDPDAVRTAAWTRGRSRSSHVTRAGPFAFHRDTGWAVSRPRGLINYNELSVSHDGQSTVSPFRLLRIISYTTKHDGPLMNCARHLC